MLAAPGPINLFIKCSGNSGSAAGIRAQAPQRKAGRHDYRGQDRSRSDAYPQVHRLRTHGRGSAHHALQISRSDQARGLYRLTSEEKGLSPNLTVSRQPLSHSDVNDVRGGIRGHEKGWRRRGRTNRHPQVSDDRSRNHHRNARSTMAVSQADVGPRPRTGLGGNNVRPLLSSFTIIARIGRFGA